MNKISTLQRIGLVVFMVVVGLAMPGKPAMAQTGSVAIDEGTYFIINADSNTALQPVTAMAGQNVFLYPFTQGGAQQWVIKRVKNNKTGKLTNRVTVQLAGPTALYLEPYTVPDNHTAIISMERRASYSLHPAGDGYQIRSYQLNGDAMYAFPVASAPTEVRFGASRSSTVWKLIPVGH